MKKPPKKQRIKKYRAAGGVVLNARAEVLLLEREVPRDDTPSHEIRLPKGHIEADENPEQAALREVGEESGYWHLQIVADLGEGEIRFTFRGRPIQRQEHYYLMRLGSAPRGAPHPSSPDAEEALFRPLWAPDLETAAAWLTFDSEKEFIRRAQQWLATHSNPWQVD